MTRSILSTPKTQTEFDAVCEQFRQAMDITFDFAISARKQNKLRDAVSRMLGYPNGFQQLKTHLMDDSKPIEPALPLNTWLATQSDTVQAVFGELAGERLALRYYDELFHDGEFLGACRINKAEFSLTENDDLEGYDFSSERDLCDLLSTEDLQAVIDYMRQAYDCVGFLITIPDVSKYGVPDNAVSSLALSHVREELGFSVQNENVFFSSHHVCESHDNGSGQVILMLKRRS